MFWKMKKDQGGLSMAYAQIDPGASFFEELREREKMGNGGDICFLTLSYYLPSN